MKQSIAKSMLLMTVILMDLLAGSEAWIQLKTAMAKDLIGLLRLYKSEGKQEMVAIGATE